MVCSRVSAYLMVFEALWDINMRPLNRVQGFPAVGKELPLKDATRVHREVMEPGAYGKIALIP